MKIKMTNSNIYLLLCLLMSPAFTTNATHQTHHELHRDDVANMTSVQKEAYLVKLINEFLDTHNHPNRAFSSFAHDLIILLESEQREDLKKFCKELSEMKKMKKSRMIGLKLIKYKHLLPKTAREAISAKNLNELETILDRRVQL